MVELAVHQKPLHQMDMFLTGCAGAAECGALHCCNRLYTCLGGLAHLVQATRLFEGRGQGGDVRGRGEMESNGGGGDQTRSQDLRMWILLFSSLHLLVTVTSTLIDSLLHFFFILKHHLIDTKM